MADLDKRLNEILERFFRGELVHNPHLREMTSLRIGGWAKYLLIPEDPLSLRNLIQILMEMAEPYQVIGGGTNILAADGEIGDLLVSLKGFKRMEVTEEGDDMATVFVESGVGLPGLLSFLREKGLSGLEPLAGIPGTVGGAVSGNAGSYGTEFMEKVTRVTGIQNGEMWVAEKEKLTPSYRDGGLPERTVVMGVHLMLERDDPQRVEERMSEWRRQKQSTQPLDQPTAGCVFRNPEGGSAGRLIDEAGCKGMRSGDIVVSHKHANFFINTGDGTAADFLFLMRQVREAVLKRSGFLLQPEIRFLGMGEEVLDG